MKPIFGDRYLAYKKYEDLQEKDKAYNNKKEEEKVKLLFNARSSARLQLKDSSSATFSGERVSRDGSICGLVNAKNSFGAYTGNVRYLYAVGVSYIDDGSSDFQNAWDKYCL
ncbi:hypothetical protein GCM10007171_21600 [Dickeya fangzhongdai]|nr:hypothetical protein GCM10007171_21600 [Dickeya fangzhongdai]